MKNKTNTFLWFCWANPWSSFPGWPEFAVVTKNITQSDFYNFFPTFFLRLDKLGFVQKYCRCLQNSEQIANPAHLRRHIFVMFFFVFAVWAYPLSAPSHLARAAARLLGKEVDNTRPSSKLLHLLLHSSLLSIDFFSRPELSIDVWDSKANVHFADK